MSSPFRPIRLLNGRSNSKKQARDGIKGKRKPAHASLRILKMATWLERQDSADVASQWTKQVN